MITLVLLCHTCVPPRYPGGTKHLLSWQTNRAWFIPLPEL